MEAMREAVLPLVNADPGLVILTIGPYDFLDPIRREADLVGKDGHAGSIETSQMLVVADAMVQMDKIPQVTRPRLSRFRVMAHPEAEYPTGVRGDTSKVSRELGREGRQPRRDRDRAPAGANRPRRKRVRGREARWQDDALVSR